jgi:RimJ/RimL family protein N-acetyltransferase
MTALRSQRLNLARPTPDDFAAIRAWQRDPELMRYLGGPRSDETILASIGEYRKIKRPFPPTASAHPMPPCCHPAR